MSNILNSFPVRLCLTMPDRRDRRELLEQELRKQKLVVEYYYAYSAATPALSFNTSQKKMIAYALAATIDDVGFFGKIKSSTPITHALFFEDDVLFQGVTHIAYAFEQLPDDWDVLYLGANITNGQPEYYSPNLFKVKTAWTTHAVAYSRRVMQYISDNFDPTLNHMFDDWLAREVLPKFNCFVIYPMACWQQVSQSDIWNVMADYTECFQKGDEMMRQLLPPPVEPDENNVTKLDLYDLL